MPAEISLDPGRQDLDLIHAELRSSYWSPGIRREIVAAAIRNSLVAGAFDRATGAQVGFARLVSDQATFAWLCDVFVLEPWRGKGIATALVKALVDEPRMASVRRIALATRDAHAVYARLGFAPVDATRWMELRPPAYNWQEPSSD